MRRLRLLGGVAVLLLVAPAIGATASVRTVASDDAAAATVQLSFGGRVYSSVTEGDVLPPADSDAPLKDKEGNCIVGGKSDGISITISNDTESAASVEVSLDDSCNLLVGEIESRTTDVAARTAARTPPVRYSLGAPHNHRGWSKATVLEQFGVTSTETYSTVTYSQDWDSVYDGRGYSIPDRSYCYVSSFPGWDDPICQYAVLDLTGPHAIRVKIHGYYHNDSPPRPTWSLDARFIATKDNSWTATCHLYDGSLPPFWDLRCDGGRTGAWT